MGVAICMSAGLIDGTCCRDMAGAYENATVVLRTVSEDVAVHGSSVVAWERSLLVL